MEANKVMYTNCAIVIVTIFAMCCMNVSMARTFDEQTPPNIMIASTSPPPAVVQTTQQSIIIIDQQPNGTCFYAEPELCHQFNESEPCRECMPHPIYPTSLICCNITDFERSLSCIQNSSGDNGTFWTNIHIRNATIDELDISQKFLKRLNSIAITDGQINKIIKEFPKFSTPKCLNVSNNNLLVIPSRALRELTRLQLLDLSHNNLTAMPNLNTHSNLTLDIRGNKGILCKSILESTERGGVMFVEPDSTYCLMNQTFYWFNSTDRIPLRQLERMKQMHSDCPFIPGYGNCTCELEQMSYLPSKGDQLVYTQYWAKVDCSSLGLINLPKTLPVRTIALNVSNNKIKSLSGMVNNPHYRQLIRLYADDNEIETFLDLEGTDFIRNFNKLHLRRNAMKTIPHYLLSYSLDRNPGGPIILLEGNKLYCDCNSATTLKYWLAARQNQITDADKIFCENIPKKRVLDLSETKLCQSPHDWTDYIYYIIAIEVFLLIGIISKVSYDYWIFKTAGYLPWPASQMPKLPCDWLCET